MIEKDKSSSSKNVSNGANFKKGSFSYINLLADDGSFPHRTHPIGDPQTSRRNSTSGMNGNFYKESVSNDRIEMIIVLKLVFLHVRSRVLQQFLEDFEKTHHALKRKID